MLRIFIIAVLFAVAAAYAADAPTTKPVDLKELQKRLDDARTGIEAANAAAVARLEGSAQYRAAIADLAAKQKNLEDARANGSAEDKLAASSAYTKAKAMIPKIRDAALRSDSGIAQAIGNAQAAKDALAQRVSEIAAEKQRQRDAEVAKRREKIKEVRGVYSAIVDAKIRGAKGVALETIPLVGDEANLALIAAKPQENLDKPFIVCGGATLNGLYIFGYRDAKATHYAYAFNVFTKDAQRGRSVWLYQKRSMGDDVVRVLAAFEQTNPNMSMLIRFRLKISSDYVKTFDEASDVYEVVDWQLADKTGKWGPWLTETQE